MGITLEEFSELQRWMKVRDCCQEAIKNLRLARELANGHNLDSKRYMEAYYFVSELNVKAIRKIDKMVGEQNDEFRSE